MNADLRSIDTINDKVRVREFYLISSEDAYELLEDIVIISGTKGRLHLYKPTKDEVQEETAEKNRELSKNRHHFKEIKFKSSLTNKTYSSKTKDDGTLGIYEEETYNFIQRSFEQGRVETNGTKVSTILPPMSMFTPNNDRQEKKNKL